jgi:methylthioribose-1-phosphate isomerase
VRTIDWRDGAVVIVDQTALPASLELLTLRTVDDLVEAIARLAVRGAPALGAAGALGVALASGQAEREGWDDARLAANVARLRAARPTAVNLARGVDRALAVRAAEGHAAVVALAAAVLDEDGTVNRAIGERGADLLVSLCNGPMRIHTHCNAGALACVEWGTALGVVRALHLRGLVRGVVVDETRPLLQGSRLTAWELEQLGVEHHVIVDGAAASVIARGLVDAVVVGADRIAANGDVANKVGTYPLALAAARAGVPFVVAAPESTVDAATGSGDEIVIEERPAEEVAGWPGAPSPPWSVRALNPAFDVTPADLVTAIVTEDRVVRPARGERPA